MPFTARYFRQLRGAASPVRTENFAALRGGSDLLISKVNCFGVLGGLGTGGEDSTSSTRRTVIGAQTSACDSEREGG
jgi:hypothetical protein